MAAVQRRCEPTRANSLVIGTQFGPDGNLYMSRYAVGCCRSDNETRPNQIVKISFNVLDQCDTDTAAPNASADVTGQAYPDTPNTYVNTAKLRLSATDSGCAGVKNLEYRQAGSTEWLAVLRKVTFDEGKTYNVEYRATDRKDNVSAVKTATFTVLKINDTTAPTATAATSGNKDQRDYFVGSATLTLSATDDATAPASSRSSTAPTAALDDLRRARRVQRGRQLHGRLPRHRQGQQHLRSPSRSRSVSSRARAARRPARTSSTARRWVPQWTRHTRNGGSPASAFTFADGQLHMPTADLRSMPPTRRRPWAR